jgi:hypothetical protein
MTTADDRETTVKEIHLLAVLILLATSDCTVKRKICLEKALLTFSLL